MKETTKILCHRCRWGAAPGALARCNCPELPNDLNALRVAEMGQSGANAQKRTAAPHDGATKEKPEQFNPVSYALPSLTAVNGVCAYFAQAGGD